MVIITRVVYKTVTTLYIASYSEGRCFEPWHEFSEYFITYNYRADRRARVCLGHSSHTDLMSVTFGACSDITTTCFDFSPLVVQVFCNVVFGFLLLLGFFF